MRKVLFFFLLFCAFSNYAFAQGAGTNNGIGTTCAADGSSTEVMDLNTNRFSYSLINDSGVDVRIGFLATGTADLTDSNSIILKAGATYADSLPNVYYGRVVCMSTTGASQVIHSTEAVR